MLPRCFSLRHSSGRGDCGLTSKRILYFSYEFWWTIVRISRQIPEKRDVCRFLNRICENKLENCRKFWNLWKLFIIFHDLLMKILMKKLINFHRFQNCRQFSNLFSQIRLKRRHTSLFSGICPEIRTKFHKKLRRKMQNSTQKMKNRKFIFHWISFAKKCWRFLAEILRSERCEGV